MKQIDSYIIIVQWMENISHEHSATFITSPKYPTD